MFISNFRNSDEYRSKIHDLIPGGSHTYSKGDDQWPTLAPAAIARGKGAYVWDLDNNQFLDCSMGLSSVSLGHAYEPVLNEVRKELEKGCNFQRPSYIEKEMSEKFLALLPGHQMVKFAKNGSTATTAAVKLARAFTGRNLVAIPTDHPFYSYDDWFIGKTACSRGVPEQVTKLSLGFDSKDLTTLAKLFADYPKQIAAVISEPERVFPMDENYLTKIISMSHKNGAIFIQDEMVTGYKTAFPGTMTKPGSPIPDMATWGKGIANGFSFCALTGKKEIMELGGIRNEGEEKLFLISSTHGGETHAVRAAIATLEEFQKHNVIAHNHKLGHSLINTTSKIIESKGLSKNIKVTSTDWMPAFMFLDRTGKSSDGLRTLAMQEMIKRGVLFQGIFVPCFSHTVKDVDVFTSAFSEMCDLFSNALEKGFESFLVGPPAKAVFRKHL